MVSNKKETATVITFETESKKAVKTSERKWGKKVLKNGFCLFPSLLLRAQRRLGLSAQQLNVLLHLVDHWWEPTRMPYPSKKTIATRMNLSPRQVQRIIGDLEQAGLLKRIERQGNSNKGKLTNKYDLSGLVLRLKELEPEFTKARKSQIVVEQSGGLEVNS